MNLKLYSYNTDSVFYHVCLGAIYTKLGNKLGAFNALAEVMKHRGYTPNDITHLTELYEQNGIKAVYEWYFIKTHYVQTLVIIRGLWR